MALVGVDEHVYADVDDDAFLFANMVLQQRHQFQHDLEKPESDCLIPFATYLLDLQNIIFS